MDTRHSSSSRPTSRGNTVAHKPTSGGLAAAMLKARGPGTLRAANALLPRGKARGSLVPHRTGHFILAEVCDAPPGISVLQYNIPV